MVNANSGYRNGNLRNRKRRAKPPKQRRIVMRDGEPWFLRPTKGWQRVKEEKAA